MAVPTNETAAGMVPQGGPTDFAQDPTGEEIAVEIELDGSPAAPDAADGEVVVEPSIVVEPEVVVEPDAPPAVQVASLAEPGPGMLEPGLAQPVEAPAEQVQVAGAGGIGSLIKDAPALLERIFTSTRRLADEAERRAGTGAPLIRNFDEQPFLTGPDYDPEAVLRYLDDAPDPSVGGEVTRYGSPLSSDQGINFEWFNFGGSSDPMKAIEMIAARLPPKSVVPQSKTVESARKALAEELNVLPDLITGKLALSPANITAARMLLAQSSERLRHWANLGAGGDAPALAQFRRQMLTHRAIVLGVRKLRSEAGRTLNALRVQVSSADADPATMLLDEYGGPGQAKAMAQMFLKLTDAKGETAASQFAWKIAFFKNADRASEVFVHGMISNLTTSVKVVLGNMQAFLMQPLDDLFAIPFGMMPRGADKTRAMALTPALRMWSWASAIPDGAKAFYQTMRTGIPVDNMGRFDGAAPSSAFSRATFSAENQDSIAAHAVNYFGHIIRAHAERGMGSVDAFTKTLIARGEQRVAVLEAGMELRRAGVPMEEVLDEMARLSIDPKLSAHGYGPVIAQRMAQMSGRATLTEPLSGRVSRAGQPWRMLDQNTVLGKVTSMGGMAINTFWRVTARAFTETYRHTPFAPILPSARKAIAAGGATRDKALGQMAMGTVLMGSLFEQALHGQITGAGPRGAMAEKMRKQGIDLPPRFSIYLGKDEQGRDVWRSYAGMEPLGGLIAIAATMAEAWQYGEPTGEEWENALTTMGFLPFEYMGELPFARSLTEAVGFVQVLANREFTSENAIKALANLTTMFAQVPVDSVIPFSAVRRAAERTVDPEKRSTEGTPTAGMPQNTNVAYYLWERAWNEAVARTPGMSDALPIIRDVFGMPVQQTYDRGWANFFQPFKKKYSDLDRVEKEYRNLAEANNELPFTKPRQQIGGIRITAEMHDAWLAEIGMSNVRSRMEDVMESREYDRAKDKGATADMANLLAAEYRDIKEEAALAVFGWDASNKRFRGDEGARFEIIGQALARKSERRAEGQPTRNMFD